MITKAQATFWCVLPAALLASAIVHGEERVTELHLHPGEVQTVTIDGTVKRVAESGDACMVSERVDRLDFRCLSAGKFTKLVWLEDGTLLTFRLLVDPLTTDQALSLLAAHLRRLPWATAQVHDGRVEVVGRSPDAVNETRLWRVLSLVPAAQNLTTAPAPVDESTDRGPAPEWPKPIMPSRTLPDVPAELHMLPGEIVKLSVNSRRFAVGDTDVCDSTSQMPRHEIFLRGLSPGFSTLLVWTPEKRFSSFVTVDERSRDQVQRDLPPLLTRYSWATILILDDRINVAGSAPSAKDAQQVNRILDAFPEVGNATVSSDR